MNAPTQPNERIEALDVLRGFALLGILLLNILGFGLLSSAYFNPVVGSELNASLNLGVWASIDVMFEGAMRGLFSMLFGAGIALFTEAARGKTAALHYKRQFWLLMFGVIDAFLLLWTGDILMVYALAGFLLYPARNASPKRLLIFAGILLVLTSLFNAGTNFGMSKLEAANDPEWTDFKSGFVQSPEAQAEELEARSTSYLTAAAWTAAAMQEILLFVVPVIMFWDALMAMLIGMALYKQGVLNGSRSNATYRNMIIFGFLVGGLVNVYEVSGAYASNFHPLETFGYAQWTYHIGRLSMAIGYIGLVMLACNLNWWGALRARLAAVGRMALTNYLMHSVIALFLFTGAGFGLVGQLERWQLLGVVLGIWALQLWFSPWWLARNRYGPVEGLWRRLTYGKPAG